MPSVTLAAQKAPAPARAVLLRVLLGALAGLVVVSVAVVYLRISRQTFIQDVLSAHPGPLLFAVAGGFVLMGFQSLRWWTVMRSVLPGLRYGHAYRAILVGFFFNSLLPMRGGDLPAGAVPRASDRRQPGQAARQ